MEAFRIASLGILAAMATLLLRQKEPSISAVFSVSCGILIFLCILARLSVLMPYLEKLMSYIENGEEYLKILLKASGITVVSEFAAGICKDSQMTSVGEMIRVFAKISLFLIGLPILIAVVDIIGGYAV